MSYVVIASKKNGSERFHVAVCTDDDGHPFASEVDAVNAACSIDEEYAVRVFSLGELAFAWACNNDLADSSYSHIEVKASTLFGKDD